MPLRLTLLVCSLALLCCGVPVLTHTPFNSPTLQKDRFAIKVQTVGFSRDRTYVRLRVFDYGDPPEFLKFRTQPLMQSASELYVPRRIGTLTDAWRYPLFSVDVPPIVEFPKPGSHQHAAEVVLAFQGLTPSFWGSLRPTGAEVNELWLKIADFGMLVTKRSNPIDNDGSLIGSFESGLVNHLSVTWAWIFSLAGFTSALASGFSLFSVVKRRRRFKATFKNVVSPKQDSGGNDEEAEMNEAELLVPNVWDEDEIAVGIRSLQHKPPLLSLYLDHVRSRFVALQNERTAKKRVDFLKQELERAKLTKELASTINELRLTGLNSEIAQLRLEVERDGLKNEKSRLPELAALEHERDSLKIQVDIAQSKQTIRDLRAASRKPKELTPEQQREKRKNEIRESIKKYEEEQQQIRNDGSLSQESQRRQINIIDRRLEVLHDELEQLETA